MRLLQALGLVLWAYISPIHCQNSSFLNPILPGWHSDPSCILVPEWDDTYLCTTSTFIAFPGLPIYASKDLINWKLASNALSRVEPLPELAISAPGQQEGTYANTIRFHDGVLYLTTTYLSSVTSLKILIFSTTDPWADEAWGDPIEIVNASGGDPDLFWDDDGALYVAQTVWGEHGSIKNEKIDLSSGKILESAVSWTGTGGRWPEGPHIYKKDGWYYLLIAEGGTELLHKVTIARSNHIMGPYEGYESNPILTNSGTDEYFQCVGHADLFQDTQGNWWGVALASRSGPDWSIYPMGRETVLFPVRWDEGEWPVLEPVRGHMSGPLPPTSSDVPGKGPWINSDEAVDFEPGSRLPRNWHQWRAPTKDLIQVSPPERPHTLKITPSRANLTADINFDPRDGLGFIGRIQAHTLFNFSVDLSFHPVSCGEEAGVTLFLTQYQHIDLGLVGPEHCNVTKSDSARLRFRVTTFGKPQEAAPETKIITLPDSWRRGSLRLTIWASDDTTYRFLAGPISKRHQAIEIGSVDSTLLSGGSGPFTGKSNYSSQIVIPPIKC